LITSQVRQAFSRAATAHVRPLHAARAEHFLETGIRFRLKGETMSEEFSPRPLSRQIFAILRAVAERATPNDRAQLRTMFLPEPPLAFWKMMAAVPQEQIDNEQCLAIWKIALRALGHIRHSSTSLGWTLAAQDFPEDRMDRLLAASGSSLPGLIDEGLRWLVSHRVEATDLSVLVTLGVADALGDGETREGARRIIALDYVRSADARKNRETGPQMQEAS
jgi:hypothetical protein